MRTTTTTAPSLADFGVTTPRPGAEPNYWRAIFTGGVNATVSYFADEPEHRAIESLMGRFGATGVAVLPPLLTLGPDPDASPTDPVVEAIVEHPDVAPLGVTPEQAAAVLAVLGGAR